MTIVVVGAGISGVFAALNARRLRPSDRIVLIDQDTDIGGLLRSDRHPNGLSFDRGTHILSCTGNAVVDQLLFQGLTASDWNRFAGAGRDLSGLLFDTSISEDSPFLPVSSELFDSERPDIRHGGQAALPLPTTSNLGDYLRGRFGERIAAASFARSVHNLYGRPLDDLDVFVAGQLPLSRVMVPGFDQWLSKSADPKFRSVAACPDQRRLPDAYVNPLPAYYPRKMGIGQLFDHLKRKLSAAGVEVLLGQRVTRLDLAGQELRGMALVDGMGALRKIDGPMTVVWCSPPFALMAALGLQRMAPKLESGWRTTIIDVMADLRRILTCFYYIDYGANPFFRLTNYAALCPEQWSKGPFPLTYEYWNRGDDLTEDAARAAVVARLLALGLIDSDSAVSDLRLRIAPQSTLYATTGNMKALARFAEELAASTPRNLLNVGLLSAPGLFFTKDVLVNAEEKMRIYLAS